LHTTGKSVSQTTGEVEPTSTTTLISTTTTHSNVTFGAKALEATIGGVAGFCLLGGCLIGIAYFMKKRDEKEKETRRPLLSHVQEQPKTRNSDKRTNKKDESKKND